MGHENRDDNFGLIRFYGTRMKVGIQGQNPRHTVVCTMMANARVDEGVNVEKMSNIYITEYMVFLPTMDLRGRAQ
jgi:hypothetical protein